MSLHPDWTDAEYFAHDALSHSDTKLLARSPAYYHHVKTTGDKDFKAEFDFGHVVHELALGEGAGIVVVDADSWRTKAAQEAKKEARAEGKAPLLRDEYEQAKACAEAVTRHPIARKLWDTADHFEIAATWDDGDVPRKAKLDLVAGRFGVDLKTTDYAETEAFGRSAGKYGYATQDAWYRDALTEAFGIDEPEFLFVVVEKRPPFLVNVIKLDPYDVDLGHKRNGQMVDLYRRCRDTDTWPAYGDGINQAQLPRWAEIEMETE